MAVYQYVVELLPNVWIDGKEKFVSNDDEYGVE